MNYPGSTGLGHPVWVIWSGPVGLAQVARVRWPGEALTPPGLGPSSWLPYLRHPIAVLGLQALLGLLEVGVLVVVGGRLQVVVHGVGGAGHGCGNCEETKEGTKKRTNEMRNIGAGASCSIT